MPFEIQPRGRVRLGVSGSEWTAVSGSSPPAGALLLGARQRRLELGLKGAGKVGSHPRVRTVTARLLWLGSDRGGCSACLLWLEYRPSGRSSNAVDCLQCSATAAGRWGGDLVPCTQDVGDHMGPSDPS